MIIGLCGFIGSGKGTVGDILQSQGFQKVAYADPLKDAVAAIFQWPRELLEGDTEPSRKFRETEDKWWSERFGYSVTPRLMLQRMGTEATRGVIHDYIWIYALESRLRGIENAVITDVRFPNEVKQIRKMGGKVIRVNRGEMPPFEQDILNKTFISQRHLEEYMDCVYPNIHSSEYAWLLEKPDLTIENNGTLEELQNKVLTFVKNFRIIEQIDKTPGLTTSERILV